MAEQARPRVLSTPIYWFGPVIGRTLDFRNRRVILTISMEDTNVSGARHAIGMLTDSLNWLKAEVFAAVIAPGVHDRGATLEHSDVLETAMRTGREATAH